MNSGIADTPTPRPNLHLVMEEAGLLLRPPVPSDGAVLASELIDPAMGVATVADPSVWTRRIALWMTGRSPDDREDWLTWVVVADGRVAGYVQATLSADRRHAELAWVLFLWAQGRGLATRAARLVAALAVNAGVTDLVAHIEPGHAASEGVARRIGLAPTDVMFEGEREWRASAGDLSPR